MGREDRGAGRPRRVRRPAGVRDAGRAALPAGVLVRALRRVPPSLLVLLAGTGALYLWGLGESGWANPFYSAAVQAGATSWKAFFFGASDSAGAITVDKAPGALWPMALSARIFGLSSWSVLVPQALMGMATVGTLYAAVRRRFPEWAALLAGTALALTPVAALMFRFNNPDALLVLLLTLGAYGMLRAQEGAQTRWLVFAAWCVGTGFLAKMLQAFLVVPVFALVYAATAPTPPRRRLWQSVLAGAALLVSAGWWVAAVALVPASSRPYVGGTQHNSVLELTLGYNGLGRLNGEETGGLGNLDQDAGWDRMFGPVIGGQVSWLLPAALVLLAAGLWTTRRAPRTDPARAAFALWGGWLVVTAAVFSAMRGIFHEYYTVALAPAIAALVGMGAAVVWERRRTAAGAAALAAVVAVTSVWSSVLLGRAQGWNPWLGPAVLVAGLVAAAGLAAARLLRERVLAGAVALAVAACLAGPAAYAADTVRTPHTGVVVTAGPRTSGGSGPGHGSGRGAGPPGPPGPGGRSLAPPPGGRAGPPPGLRGAPEGERPTMALLTKKPSAAVTAALTADAASYTWVAATVGSYPAAGYQLAARRPVMAVGGFNGTDPAPTLAGFQRLVRERRIHYFVVDTRVGIMGGQARSGSAEGRRIAAWVAARFRPSTVDGVTLYDLSPGAA
ncbi:glycosyltransferase family 39 protein [Actinomadura sp. NEAU-AAG7]|nr:glycosyltransferase family 39 protein [Actinomadura sp. NEAU-AAG7]